MNGHQILPYQDILAVAQEMPVTDSSGFVHRKSEDKAWGCMEERRLTGEHFEYVNYQADFNKPFKVNFDEPCMQNSMNVCLALDGELGLNLKNSGVSAGLSTKRHHSLYSNETEYELLVRKYVHVVHITIDREFYANLLCDQHRWTADVKEKLLRKERVVTGDLSATHEMLHALQVIQHNPLSGNLKRLLIEVKILELMALQIGQFTTEKNSSLKLKSSDIDIFHDLRRHLDIHFSDDLSLKSLSRTFGLNEFKLKKGFRELFHSTVFDYIHERRMNHAQHLLLEQKMYISEVARTVGYKNANHFSTAFKRRFGITPTEIK